MNDSPAPFFVGLAFCVVSFAGGVYVAAGITREIVQDEAIAAGVAHWVVDEKTGETQFVFIKGEKP